MKRKNLNYIEFSGSNFLRQRIVLSVLTGKSISVRNIRSSDTEPGLKEYEINLLRLVDKITNGTWLEVNETGTAFSFSPGTLIGGTFDHECCRLRAIGYYLEVITALAPFCKKPLILTLRGVTNNSIDPSVDAFKQAGLGLLKRFVVVDPGIELQVKKRGLEPEGGGEIYFHCPIIKLKAVQLKDMGKVKKVRGVAFAARLSPALANRFIDSAKSNLLKFLPDVFITCDFAKGKTGGKSPGMQNLVQLINLLGFGGCLIAETTTGVQFTAEKVTPPPPGQRQVPEDMGRDTSWLLMEEISRGGIIDSSFQALAFIFMAFGQKDVSQIVTGPLSPYSIETLRNLRLFLGITYKLEPYLQPGEEHELNIGVNKVLVTGVGVGYQRFA